MEAVGLRLPRQRLPALLAHLQNTANNQTDSQFSARPLQAA
jgi:hypothetical protein